MIRYGKAKIVGVHDSPEGVVDTAPRLFSTRLAQRLANIDSIRMDPSKYTYLRNRAISAEETWGPNQNWDGFPGVELRGGKIPGTDIISGFRTFAGTRVDIDHNPDLRIGFVADSMYVPLGVRMADDIESGSPVIRAFAGYESLAPGDQIVGNWIENVWAVHKDQLNALYPHAVEAIRDGEITDTSMGTDIKVSECSVCGHRTEDPEIIPYCEHIGAMWINKGTLWEHPETGAEVRSFERCYGLEFFEDSLILPEQWNGNPGSHGADVSAKILQVFAASKMSPDEVRESAAALRRVYSMLPESERKRFLDILVNAVK